MLMESSYMASNLFFSLSSLASDLPCCAAVQFGSLLKNTGLGQLTLQHCELRAPQTGVPSGNHLKASYQIRRLIDQSRKQLREWEKKIIKTGCLTWGERAARCSGPFFTFQLVIVTPNEAGLAYTNAFNSFDPDCLHSSKTIKQATQQSQIINYMPHS